MRIGAHQTYTLVKEVSGKDKIHVTYETKPFAESFGTQGYVRSNDLTTIHVNNTHCRNYYSWVLGNKQNPSDEQAAAIHIIIHESIHLRGITDETETDCKATNSTPLLVMKLYDVPKEVGDEMKDSWNSTYYPSLPSEYKTHPCTEYGFYDQDDQK